MSNLKHTLFIRIDGRQETEEKAGTFFAQMVALNSDGQVILPAKPPVAFSRLVADTDSQLWEEGFVVVLLPAAKVFFTTVVLPEKQMPPLMQHPAYAIEEQVIQPIDSLQVAAGRALAAGEPGLFRAGIAAVDRIWLQALYANLPGVVPDAVISEACLLFPESGHIDVLLEPWRSLVSTATFASAFDTAALSRFLGIMVRSVSTNAGGTASSHMPHTPFHTLNVYAVNEGSTGQASEPVQALYAYAEEQGYHFRYNALTMPVLEMLAGNWMRAPHHQEIPNLALPRPRRMSLKGSGPLARRAALILAAWFCAHIVINFVCGWYINHRTASAYEQLARHVPGYGLTSPTAGTNAIRAQIKTYIAGHAAQASGVIAFAGSLTDALVQAGQPFEVTGLQYLKANRILAVRVTAHDFTAFEKFKSELSRAGIDAQVESLRLEAGSVKGIINAALP